MQRLKVGEHVDVGQGVIGVIVRAEILGDEPPPSETPAITAAAHNPGAMVYVVRYEINGETVETLLEEHEVVGLHAR